MKINRLFTLLITSVLSLTFMNCDMKKEEKTETEITVENKSVLRHVVLFKFKEDASADKIKIVEETFNALPSKIPQIKSYEWGLNNSPEGLNKDFTHCYFLTFASEEDRAVYLPHPDHKAFGATLDGVLDDVLVVDYWSSPETTP